MTIVAVFNQTNADPIPDTAIAHIPFIAEPVRAWTPKCDLALFIRELSNLPMTSLQADGKYRTGVSPNHEASLFAEAKRNATELQRGFARRNNRHWKKSTELRQFVDVTLGVASKYECAWDALTSSILSESAFSSLPHILEAGTDLECCFDLALKHYYKQASQILRGFLEGQVIDLLLARDGQAFKNWRQGTYRIPNLRGRDGVLQTLVRQGVLAESLRGRIDSAYRELNAYIHGAESTLVHSGLFTGEHRGHEFNPKKLEAWSAQLCNIVGIGILLFKKKTEIWLSEFRSQPRMCGTCRETTLKDIESFSFGGKDFVKRRCQICGHDATVYSGSEQQVYVVTVQ